MSAIWVEITGTRGSCPRDAGTAMKVTATQTIGTIGGGALELQAIAMARKVLGDLQGDFVRTIPLGPDLGQCCGGAVTLRFTRDNMDKFVDKPAPALKERHLDHPPPRQLWLWGAGHVGRAVVRASHPQIFEITWVDSAADRFPAQIPTHVKPVSAADMPLLAARAPREAHHLIFTYSHEIDFDLSAALLQRGAASIGLIGSDTKRARFFRRLKALGLQPDQIICPIGDKRLGKSPDQIATGILQSFTAEVMT